MNQTFSAGQKVILTAAMTAPAWCVCDDDKGRVAKHVKKTILERFFKVDKKLTCEIVYVSNEVEREKLRKAGRAKVRVRTPAGECIIIPIEINKLKRA